MNKKAFTLIELLVVIAIIAVLASLAIVSLIQARQRALDTKILSETRQMQTVLELYFNENNRYPSLEEFVLGDTLVSPSTNNILMNQIPSVDFTGDTCFLKDYTYLSNSDLSDYSLFFCLASDRDDLKKGVQILKPKSFLFKTSNNYLKFNGYDHCLNAGNHESLEFDSSMSLGAWVRFDSLSGNLSIARKDISYVIGANWNANKFRFFIYTNSWKYTPDSISTIEKDKWYFVVGTYDADSYPDNLKLYINGELESVSSVSGLITSRPEKTNLTIACRDSYNSGNFDEFIDGDIDNVFVYNRALSDKEISDLYLGSNVYSDGLAAYWNFDIIDNCTAFDYSQYQNHANMGLDCPLSIPTILSY